MKSTLIRIPFRLGPLAFQHFETLRQKGYSVAHLMALGIVKALEQEGIVQPGEARGGVVQEQSFSGSAAVQEISSAET